MTTTRYSLEPLAAALGVELGRPGRHDDDSTLHGWEALADALPPRRHDQPWTVGQLRYRHGLGGLDTYEADRCATHLRRHPDSIWPTWSRDLDCNCDPDLECSCGFYAEDEPHELQVAA